MVLFSFCVPFLAFLSRCPLRVVRESNKLGKAFLCVGVSLFVGFFFSFLRCSASLRVTADRPRPVARKKRRACRAHFASVTGSRTLIQFWRKKNGCGATRLFCEVWRSSVVGAVDCPRPAQQGERPSPVRKKAIHHAKGCLR